MSKATQDVRRGRRHRSERVEVECEATRNRGRDTSRVRQSASDVRQRALDVRSYARRVRRAEDHVGPEERPARLGERRVRRPELLLRLGERRVRRPERHVRRPNAITPKRCQR
jgi:hypothetical protein